MRMSIIGFALWGALEPIPAWALNCKPLEPKSGSDVRQGIQGEVDAKILGLLGRLAGGGASIDGVYKYIQKDVLSEYGQQASQLYVWERLIYLKCEQLNESSASESDKNIQFNELYQTTRVGPPEIERSEKPIIGALFIMEAMIISGNSQRPEMTRTATKKLQSMCNGERSCIVFLDEEALELQSSFQQVYLRYFCGPDGEEVEERHRYGRSIRVSCE